MQSQVFATALYVLKEKKLHERQDVSPDPEQVPHLKLHALQTEVIGSRNWSG
jgi:hypothetical protein